VPTSTNLETVGYYGSPVQVDGDREALRPPERLRGSVHTSARRLVTTALAIVSRVARLASVFVSRETEADGLENDESRGNSRLKRTLKGPVATRGAE